jgi:Rrf2 family protein
MPLHALSTTIPDDPVAGVSRGQLAFDLADGTLMISQKAKYALRALTALAQADTERPLMISEIATQQAIPKKFLEQILLELKRNGIVESRRGKQGGYLLLKPAQDITFGEILRLIDGPIAPLPCLSQTAYRRCEDCDGEHLCEIRHVFARVADASRDVLFSTTIADAVGGVEDARALELAIA